MFPHGGSMARHVNSKVAIEHACITTVIPSSDQILLNDINTEVLIVSCATGVEWNLLYMIALFML